MDCSQARQLFDAYLDGELTGSLKTELGAHRLRCADCRRELALLEVTGHIITSDREIGGLNDGFTDRLLACMPRPQHARAHRYRRALYLAAPLVAAALIAIAVSGTWRTDRGNRVAGEIVVAGPDLLDLWASEAAQSRRTPESNPAADARATELDRLFGQMRENLAAKRQAGESVQQFFGLSIIQMLEIVNHPESPAVSETGGVMADESSADPTDDADGDAHEVVEDL